MRTRLLVPALTLALLALACGGAAKWETVSEGGMSVELPGKPQKENRSVPTPGGPMTVNALGVERSSNEAFVVTYNGLPQQITSVPGFEKTLLDGARDSLIKSTSGTLTGERTIQLGPHNGREFVGDVPSKNASFTARIYLANSRMYQVMSIYPKGKPITADGEKFLSSFKIS